MYCDELTPKSISHYGFLKKAEDIVMQRKKFNLLQNGNCFGTSPRPRTDLLVNDFVYKAYFDKKYCVVWSHFKKLYTCKRCIHVYML